METALPFILYANLLAYLWTFTVQLYTALGLAVFATKDYDQASLAFGQRKDKPLTSFQPSLFIPLQHRVISLSVNCSGSFLLLAHEANSIRLLNTQQLVGYPFPLH